MCFGRKKPKEIEVCLKIFHVTFNLLQAEKVIPYNVNKIKDPSPKRLDSFIPIKPPCSAGAAQQEECSVEFDSQEKWSPPTLSPHIDAENMQSPSGVTVMDQNKKKVIFKNLSSDEAVVAP